VPLDVRDRVEGTGTHRVHEEEAIARVGLEVQLEVPVGRERHRLRLSIGALHHDGGVVERVRLHVDLSAQLTAESRARSSGCGVRRVVRRAAARHESGGGCDEGEGDS
jgi:hypothetical protein